MVRAIQPTTPPPIPAPRPAFKVAGNGRRMSFNGVGKFVNELPRENPWEPYTLKLFPKRINSRWYFAGDTVYRRSRFGPGGYTWVYGDEFDYLKWTS